MGGSAGSDLRSSPLLCAGNRRHALRGPCLSRAALPRLARRLLLPLWQHAVPQLSRCLLPPHVHYSALPGRCHLRRPLRARHVQPPGAPHQGSRQHWVQLVPRARTGGAPFPEQKNNNNRITCARRKSSVPSLLGLCLAAVFGGLHTARRRSGNAASLCFTFSLPLRRTPSLHVSSLLPPLCCRSSAR